MELRKKTPAFRHNKPCESVWSQTPDTLLDIAARSCVFKHLKTWTHKVTDTSHATLKPEGSLPSGSSTRLALRPDVILPDCIVQKLIEVAQDGHFPNINAFLGIFKTSKPKKIDLVDVSVTDKVFKQLLSNEVRHISLQHCHQLTVQSLNALNDNSDQLVNLHINSRRLMLDYLQPEGLICQCQLIPGNDSQRDKRVYEERGYIIRAPKLRRLNVQNLVIKSGPNFFEFLLKPLGGLTHLDLSGCRHDRGPTDIHWLKNCPRLVSLCLHNIKGCGWDISMDAGLEVLITLVHLQHLDISQAEESIAFSDQPEKFLRTLVTSLPQLTSLDISGTNLAKQSNSETLQEIPGLESRKNRPFEFLGLFKTQEDACARKFLPARVVTGTSNPEKILEAARRYMNRPKVMTYVMDELYTGIGSNRFKHLSEVLDLILQAMDRNLNNNHIQICGSLSLQTILRASRLERNVTKKMVEKTASVLLNAMWRHKDDLSMMLNGLITLHRFVAKDVMFDFDRIIRIALHASHLVNQPDNFVQQEAIMVLLNFINQVSLARRELIGNFGAIEMMLDLIADRVERKVYDDPVRLSWCVIWNLVGEVPVNADRFIEEKGLDIYLICKDTFPNKPRLNEHMLLLLTKIAEFPEHRRKLMSSDFVKELLYQITDSREGFENAFHAAAVLVHLLSDGAAAWTITSPKRTRVLNKLVNAVESWKMDTRRSIRYWSLKPFVRLLSVNHTVECQLWATWSLANLTMTSPVTYCKLVVEEDGFSFIRGFLFDDSQYSSGSEDMKTSLMRDDVKTYAWVIRKNIQNWMKEGCPDANQHLIP